MEDNYKNELDGKEKALSDLRAAIREAYVFIKDNGDELLDESDLSRLEDPVALYPWLSYTFEKGIRVSKAMYISILRMASIRDGYEDWLNERDSNYITDGLDFDLNDDYHIAFFPIYEGRADTPYLMYLADQD